MEFEGMRKSDLEDQVQVLVTSIKHERIARAKESNRGDPNRPNGEKWKDGVKVSMSCSDRGAIGGSHDRSQESSAMNSNAAMASEAINYQNRRTNCVALRE